MKELIAKDQRRIATLIASPLKEEGATGKVAEYAVITATQQMTRLFKQAFGITITPQQQDEIRQEAMEKLG